MLKNGEDWGKLIVAKGFKKLPKVQNIAQSGHTGNGEHYPSKWLLAAVFINYQKIDLAQSMLDCYWADPGLHLLLQLQLQGGSAQHPNQWRILNTQSLKALNFKKLGTSLLKTVDSILPNAFYFKFSRSTNLPISFRLLSHNYLIRTQILKHLITS